MIKTESSFAKTRLVSDAGIFSPLYFSSSEEDRTIVGIIKIET